MIVKMAQTGLYWQAAGTAVVLYDHLTTFDQEVEFIWPQSWSLVKILYLLSQFMTHGNGLYFPALLGPSSFQIQSWLGMITLFTMNGLVVKRISCMYAGNRMILYLLVGAYAVQIVAGAVLTGLIAPKGGNVVSPLTSTSSYCTPSISIPRWFWTFLFYSVTFEVIVFALALVQGIRFLRARKPAPDPHATSMVDRIWNRQGNLVRILIRDSISFPFIGLVLSVFNILAFKGKLPPPTTQIILVISAANSPILGCRLLLNLREAYYKPFHVEFDPQQDPTDEVVLPSLENDTSSKSPSPAP
ncbi:hypothetical protein BKA70DRAFT_1475024 [Coprinopsis sp. MPI-PUGE-AT-0042]|nr:hypothetical protein BKA70DRAFT_1475024 [Coprinopsis sp. MPI-PUGE-AT-0042]